MADLSELFWKSSLEEMKRGFRRLPDTGTYVCLICGKAFEDGVIHRIGEILYEARKAVERHIAEAHGPVFTFLLSLDRKLTGLTDHQKKLLELFHAGRSDGEAAAALGTGSTSTIRNHRFQLRERQKQAKILLGIMELLEEKIQSKSDFVEIPRTARQVDERFAITQQENDAILAAYFPQGLEGPLKTLPIKEKRRIAILRHLITFFDGDRTYTEKQVNGILERFYHDYAMLRRNMIEYGFLERKPDGSSYWIKLR
ncbi:MAG TPA: DUF2087 domain-containing protein [Candidatus Ozemobacteraceae bacterium]|nr:DUF2087 domain-containing protein [Candidatus Ozemobacteraceae bacterium]